MIRIWSIWPPTEPMRNQIVPLDAAQPRCAYLFVNHCATRKEVLARDVLRNIQLPYELESEVRDLEPALWLPIWQEKTVSVMNRFPA
ncbi:hypothetical protein ACW9I5_32860 [Pseudomonas azotoformans]